MATYVYPKPKVIEKVVHYKKTQISYLKSRAEHDLKVKETAMQTYKEAKNLPWWNIKRYFVVSPDLKYLECLNRLIKDLECDNIPYSFCRRYSYLNNLMRYHNTLVKLDDTIRMESLLNTYPEDEVILSEEELQRYMK